MKRINVNGEEAVNKKTFDKKINLTQPLFRRILTFNQWSDVIGDFDNSGSKGILLAVRDDLSDNNKYTSGGNGSGIVFGGLDTHAILTARWNEPVVTITAGNDPKPNWSEEIAFKSDIQKLQQEIVDLKKQIGGVNSHLTHISQESNYVTFNRLEVA